MDFCKKNDDGDHENPASPEIVERDAQISGNLLSKERYKHAYKQFMGWHIKNKMNSFSQDVLVTYFGELSTKYKSSTLWSIYSMLRAMLVAKHDVNIATYCKLRDLLKKESVNYVAKRPNYLTSDNIKTFLERASDEFYLLTKTALIFGICGCMCKGEIYNVKLGDVKDVNSTLIVDVPLTKTKKSRQFVITDNFYMICKKYINLRPTGMTDKDQRFFVNFHKGKCTKQFVGINKFGRLVQDVAKFLKLPNPETYTGHSYKRTSAIVANQTGDLALNCQSSGNAEVNDSITKEIKIFKLIVEAVPSHVSAASQSTPFCATTLAAPENNSGGSYSTLPLPSTSQESVQENSVQQIVNEEECGGTFIKEEIDVDEKHLEEELDRIAVKEEVDKEEEVLIECVKMENFNEVEILERKVSRLETENQSLRKLLLKAYATIRDLEQKLSMKNEGSTEPLSRHQDPSTSKCELLQFAGDNTVYKIVTQL